uniref:Molybdopterin synthase catalytic subunit n=1 Tax=Setaria digitata TaxID=48799 RepID=A0A915Q4J3_9BILA
MKDFICWSKRHKMQNDSINGGAYVLGIAGCTNSGKTTLSKTLSTALINEGVRVTVLSQDAFYYNEEQIERVVSRADPKIIFCNYDTIKAMDTNKFILSVQNAIDENNFVIVEGNMILEISKLHQFLHRSIFLTLSYDLCAQRRATRKYDPPDLPGYMEEIAWPAYRKHLANAHSLARRSSVITFVDGNNEKFWNISEVKMLFSKISKNLLLIQADGLQLPQAVEFVNKPEDGGISIFLGTTRGNFGDKQVVRLEFEAYDEMVYKEMEKLCDEVRKSYPSVDRIALFHRVGKVFVGEISVIMAVCAPHRQDVFRAMEKGIDYLKNRVPIWKKEVYSDGTYCWKENMKTC